MARERHIDLGLICRDRTTIVAFSSLLFGNFAVCLHIGQKCPILILTVKGSEFLRKVKALADERNVKTALIPHRGKGSHQTLYFGDRFTIIRSLKDELKKGTLHGMLRQLGIDPSELQ